jgi:hypothetical protein
MAFRTWLAEPRQDETPTEEAFGAALLNLA